MRINDSRPRKVLAQPAAGLSLSLWTKDKSLDKGQRWTIQKQAFSSLAMSTKFDMLDMLCQKTKLRIKLLGERDVAAVVFRPNGHFSEPPLSEKAEFVPQEKSLQPVQLRHQHNFLLLILINQRLCHEKCQEKVNFSESIRKSWLYPDIRFFMTESLTEGAERDYSGWVCQVSEKADISYRRDLEEVWDRWNLVFWHRRKKSQSEESHRRWNVLRQSHQSRGAIARIELAESKCMNAMPMRVCFSSVYILVMWWGCFGKLRLCQMGHGGSALWLRGRGRHYNSSWYQQYLYIPHHRSTRRYKLSHNTIFIDAANIFEVF